MIRIQIGFYANTSQRPILKETTIVQWSVVYNFSLVIIDLHPKEKGQEICVRSNSDYYQAIFSTAFTLD